MKKNFFRYAFVAAALCCGFASCSDDDDPAEIPFLEKTSTFNDKTGLQLTYSEAPLLGKVVTFAPNADKTKATITIKGETFSHEVSGQTLNLQGQALIPGQQTTTLNVNLTNKEDGSTTFAGQEIQAGDTIVYAGTGRNGKFTLDVKVKMQRNDLIGKTYEAQPGGGFFTPSVFHIDWIADPFPMVDAATGDTIGSWDIKGALNMILTMAQVDGQSLPQLFCGLLNKVSFLPDGNIQAVYSKIEKKDTTAIDSVAAPANVEKEWLTSPLNLATYKVVGNNQLRLFLNPIQIAAVANQKDGRANEQGSGLEGLFGTLFGAAQKACAEGILLEYQIAEDGTMNIYLTQETLLPIMKAAKPLFEDEAFVNMLLLMIKNKAGEMAPIVDAFVKPILVNMPNTIETTTKMNIGLHLVEVK